MKLRLKDIILSLFIGEASAWLLIGIASYTQIIDKITALVPIWAIAVFAPIGCLIWLKITQMLSRKFAAIFQFGKFVLIGGFNFLIDLGVLNLLFYLTGMSAGVWYSFFKSLSFLVANVNSYIFNRGWAFKSHQDSASGEINTGRQFLTFFAVSFVGMLINTGVASIVVNVVGPVGEFNPEQWGNIGAIIASAVALFWNFIGYKLFVFNKK